jgi:hypothetical protein
MVWRRVSIPGWYRDCSGGRTARQAQVPVTCQNSLLPMCFGLSGSTTYGVVADTRDEAGCQARRAGGPMTSATMTARLSRSGVGAVCGPMETARRTRTGRRSVSGRRVWCAAGLLLLAGFGCGRDRETTPPPAEVRTRWACFGHEMSSTPEDHLSFFWLDVVVAADSLRGVIRFGPLDSIPIHGSHEDDGSVSFGAPGTKFRGVIRGDSIAGLWTACDPATGVEYGTHPWEGHRESDEATSRSLSGVWLGTLYGFGGRQCSLNSPLELQAVQFGNTVVGTLDLDMQRPIAQATLRGDSLQFQVADRWRLAAVVRGDTLDGTWRALRQGDCGSEVSTWVATRYW